MKKIKMIDLFVLCSEGSPLPKTITIDDVKFTNISEKDNDMGYVYELKYKEDDIKFNIFDIFQYRGDKTVNDVLNTIIEVEEE